MTTLLAGTDLSSGSQLLGFGAAQPSATVAARDLGAPFGKSAEWVQQRTGIRALRRISAPESLGELAERAATDALAAAALNVGDVDLLVIATCSMSNQSAATLAGQIAPGTAWMAINAACSGFSYAVQTADNFIRIGTARHVLIVAAERMSRFIDPADLGTSIIFADGAGAAVLGPSKVGDPGVGPAVTGSAGEHRHLIELPPDGHLEMAGREVFRWAVELVPPLARVACSRAGVELHDIDVFVPHQANLRIINAVTRALQLQNVVVAVDVTVSGNTSAASIPIALTRLIESGRVRPLQLALLVGFGAGLAFAAQVVRLPGEFREPARNTEEES